MRSAEKMAITFVAMRCHGSDSQIPSNKVRVDYFSTQERGGEWGKVHFGIGVCALQECFEQCQ